MYYLKKLRQKKIKIIITQIFSICFIILKDGSLLKQIDKRKKKKLMKNAERFLELKNLKKIIKYINY